MTPLQTHRASEWRYPESVNHAAKEAEIPQMCLGSGTKPDSQDLFAVLESVIISTESPFDNQQND